MTDSDDDWFEKDIDDFVVKTQPSNVEIISVSAKKNAEPIVTPTAVFADGGNFIQILNIKSYMRMKAYE